MLNLKILMVVNFFHLFLYNNEITLILLYLFYLNVYVSLQAIEYVWLL